ncbi:MAG: cyclic nucleotide-binding domain-containing protein [Spirochaetota bacterium]|nr:cyclic nucleotide-binding domain-containing protein [Spirochaetota bacterium]
MALPLQVSISSFKKGAFIMIEGKQESGSFFIVKNGSVRISKEFKVDEDSDMTLTNGDFFGLISCMSGHPREESAQAITETDLIEVADDQFGALIQNNAPIAMKIIRSFSKRLRYLDHKMTEVTGAEVVEDDPAQLYEIGNYYNGIKQYNQALYAFIRYVQYVPDGENTNNAKNKIQSLSPLAKDAMNPNNQQGLQKTFKDSTVIFCEHEKGNELYILQQGQVKITKVLDNNEKLIAVLKPGDIFGEMAILDDKPRSATAIAYGDINVMAVNNENFQAMVTSQPQLATKLITLLSERLWTGFRQLANNLLKNPVGKLFDTLLLQVEKERIKIGKVPFTFEFGPKELVGMAGLPQDQGKIAFSEILKNKKFQLVENGKKIRCTDLEELQKEVNIAKNMEMREAARAKKEKSKA